MEHKLNGVGERLDQARRDLDHAMSEARRYVILSHEQGYSIYYIAKRTGLSRQTIYKILRDRNAPVE